MFGWLKRDRPEEPAGEQEPDEKDQALNGLVEKLEQIKEWNEGVLGMHSPYLGKELNAILTGRTSQFGFQIEFVTEEEGVEE